MPEQESVQILVPGKKGGGASRARVAVDTGLRDTGLFQMPGSLLLLCSLDPGRKI